MRRLLPLILIFTLMLSLIPPSQAQRTLTLPPVQDAVIPTESLLISGFQAPPGLRQPRLDLRAGVFTVNTTQDSSDSDVFDGKCKDSNKQCSLRAAVQQANALAPGSTITVPAGTYVLSVSDGTDNRTALFIDTAMTIRGAGVGITIIDGNAKGTIFNVSVNGDLTVRNLTITNGRGLNEPGPVPGRTGGAAFITGSATFERVLVTSSTANAIGGIAVSIGGSLSLNQSAVVNNTATGGDTPYPFTVGGVGGSTATITITNTTISGNNAADGAGLGLFNGSEATLNQVTIAHNTASVIGGGLDIVTTTQFPALSTITISNSIVASNTAPTHPDCSAQLDSTGDNLFSSSDGCGVNANDIIAAAHGLRSLKTSANGHTPTHALRANSPAVNSANPSTCLTRDQRREPRVFGTCDMGAYELGETIANGGMENDSNSDGVPNNWEVANATNDTRVCDDGAFAGNCAFVFTGGAGEKAKLTQNINLTGMKFQAGDELSLQMRVKAPNSAVDGKVKLRVTYSDGTPNTTFTLDFSQSAGYVNVKGKTTLTSKNVSALRVQVTHKSAAGSVSVDEISLVLNP